MIVITGALGPHAMNNAEPFVGERPHGGVVAQSFGSLLLVVGAGPVAVLDGFAGPLVDALLDEKGAGPAAQGERVGPVAGAVEHRCDAAETEDGSGGGKAFPVGAEGGQQTGAVDPSGARQAFEDEGVGVLAVGLNQLGFHPLDRALEDLDCESASRCIQESTER